MVTTVAAVAVAGCAGVGSAEPPSAVAARSSVEPLKFGSGAMMVRFRLNMANQYSLLMRRTMRCGRENVFTEHKIRFHSRSSTHLHVNLPVNAS